MLWKWNQHQSTSLTKLQKDLQAHGCKPWVTNLLIVSHTIHVYIYYLQILLSVQYYINLNRWLSQKWTRTFHKNLGSMASIMMIKRTNAECMGVYRTCAMSHNSRSHPPPPPGKAQKAKAQKHRLESSFAAGHWCPIAYFSKQLHVAQKQHSTFDRELLAIHQAIKHFRHFVKGRQFMFLTDHKPLTGALLASSDKHTSRQVWHPNYISEFASDICHVQGIQNQPADALSHICAHAVATGTSNTIDFAEMAAAQMDNHEVQR